MATVPEERGTEDDTLSESRSDVAEEKETNNVDATNPEAEQDEEEATPASPKPKKKSTSHTPTHSRTSSIGLDLVPLMDDSRLPPGWYRQVTQRKIGASAGKYDVYIHSPYKKKFRSRQEIARYAEKHNLDLNIEDFDFSVHGNQSPKKGPKKGKKSVTPKKAKVSVSQTKASQTKAAGSPKKSKTPKGDAKSIEKKKKQKESATFAQKLVVKMAFPGFGKKRKSDDDDEEEAQPKRKKKRVSLESKPKMKKTASTTQVSHKTTVSQSEESDNEVGENSHESVLSDNEIENTEPVSLNKVSSPVKERKNSVGSAARKNSVSSGSPLARLNKSDYESDVSEDPTASPRAKYPKAPSECKGSTASIRRSYSSISTGNPGRSPSRTSYRRGSGQLLAGL